MTDKLPEKHWYVINCYSGRERRVKENIERRAESMNLKDYIFRVLVCEKEEPVLRQNKPTGRTKMVNSYPGYVFVEMIMTDETWFMVRNTPDVTGLTGSSGKGAKPTEVPPESMENVLKQMGLVDDTMFSRYNVGDYVRILRGTLEGAEGEITAINVESQSVTVQTVFFGRSTSVEVEFSDVDKI